MRVLNEKGVKKYRIMIYPNKNSMIFTKAFHLNQ